MRKERNLQPLLDRYSPQAIWDAAIETLGYPPNLMLGTDSLLRVQAALEGK